MAGRARRARKARARAARETSARRAIASLSDRRTLTAGSPCGFSAAGAPQAGSATCPAPLWGAQGVGGQAGVAARHERTQVSDIASARDARVNEVNDRTSVRDARGRV